MGERLYEIAVEDIGENKTIIRIKGSTWMQPIKTDLKDGVATIELGRNGFKGLRGVAREE